MAPRGVLRVFFEKVTDAFSGGGGRKTPRVSRRVAVVRVCVFPPESQGRFPAGSRKVRRVSLEGFCVLFGGVANGGFQGGSGIFLGCPTGVNGRSGGCAGGR